LISANSLGSIESLSNVMHNSGRVVGVLTESEEPVLYYGSRKSDKLVRCYLKPRLGFRVELELHSGLLRHHQISTLDDLHYLPQVIQPKHFQFVDLDWVRLKRYLTVRFGARGHKILVCAQSPARSIRWVLRYLRRKNVPNPHRFLVPLPMNEAITRALSRWVRQF
jgi:hypothetical protein